MDTTGQTANSVTIKTYDDNKELGTISLAGGKLVGSDSGMQDIADVWLQIANGDAAEALRQHDGWQNGYLFASSDSSATVN